MILRGKFMQTSVSSCAGDVLNWLSGLRGDVYVPYLFGSFCFKYIRSINSPAEYRRKAEYLLS